VRVTVADVVSPSYFVATAAVELGFFKQEGLDAEFVFPPADRPEGGASPISAAMMARGSSVS